MQLKWAVFSKESTAAASAAAIPTAVMVIEAIKDLSQIKDKENITQEYLELEKTIYHDKHSTQLILNKIIFFSHKNHKNFKKESIKGNNYIILQNNF